MELLQEFNNLSQGDSLEEYNRRFRELRLWLLSINPYLRESYFIWCYIKGLELKIKSLVQLGRPNELEEAMKLAKLHSKSIPAAQELAPQTNSKPISSIFSPTETGTPYSTSTVAIDVLGEGQTIQDIVDQDTIKRQEGINRKIDTLIEWVTNRQTGAELFRSEIISQSGQESGASIVDENQLGAPSIDDAFSDDDDELQNSQEAAEALSQEIGNAPMTDDRDELANSKETIEASSQETKVILNPCEITKRDSEIKLLVELVVLLIEWIEIRLANSSTNPIGCLGNFSACKVFVEMPSLIVVDCCLGFDSFEPKSVSFGTKIKQSTRNWPYDRRKFDVGKRGICCLQSVENAMLPKFYKVRKLIGDQNLNLKLMNNGVKSLPFDRGVVSNSVKAHGILLCILTFDPDG